VGKHRKPFRAPGAPQLPQMKTPDQYYRGLLPNVMHDSDPHSSDVGQMVRELGQATAIGIRGTTQTADINVTAGHKHDTLDSDLDWEEFGHFQPLGDLGEPASVPIESLAGIAVGSTTRQDQAWVIALIPLHVTEARVRARVSSPAPGSSGAEGTLWVGADAYDLTVTAAGVIQTLDDMSCQSVAGGIQIVNKWLYGARIFNLQGYGAAGPVRVVGVKFNAFVSAGQSVIWELSVGRWRY
jgi:hypothetical protein